MSTLPQDIINAPPSTIHPLAEPMSPAKSPFINNTEKYHSVLPWMNQSEAHILIQAIQCLQKNENIYPDRRINALE
jgi:hypothetical protein